MLKWFTLPNRLPNASSFSPRKICPSFNNLLPGPQISRLFLDPVKNPSLSLCLLPGSRSDTLSPSASAPSSGPQHTLIMDTLLVFDFDYSLIDCNSDPWVVDHLGASDIMQSLHRSLPWTSLMDRMMTEIHARGKTISDIKDSLMKIPLQPEMIKAIQSSHALGCELRVVSDANLFFIKTVLDTHDLEKYFTEVHTNPAYVDEQGVLRICPYVSSTDTPHGCPLCPPNMCKGMILDGIRAKSQPARRRTIYIGDGSGDYCPSLRLEEGDHVLARQGFPLWRLLKENPNLVKAEVHGWSSAQDVDDCLLRLLKS